MRIVGRFVVAIFFALVLAAPAAMPLLFGIRPGYPSQGLQLAHLGLMILLGVPWALLAMFLPYVPIAEMLTGKTYVDWAGFSVHLAGSLMVGAMVNGFLLGMYFTGPSTFAQTFVRTVCGFLGIIVGLFVLSPDVNPVVLIASGLLLGIAFWGSDTFIQSIHRLIQRIYQAWPR